MLSVASWKVTFVPSFCAGILPENSTDFVLNSHFATVTLYDEAFVVGKVATAGA